MHFQRTQRTSSTQNTVNKQTQSVLPCSKGQTLWKHCLENWQQGPYKEDHPVQEPLPVCGKVISRSQVASDTYRRKKSSKMDYLLRGSTEFSCAFAFRRPGDTGIEKCPWNIQTLEEARTIKCRFVFLTLHFSFQSSFRLPTKLRGYGDFSWKSMSLLPHKGTASPILNTTHQSGIFFFFFFFLNHR